MRGPTKTSISSRPGKGDLRPRGQGPAPPPTAADPRAPLILLVEDDRDNREMYRQYLEWDGFRVVVATDGRQAVDQAAVLVPTAVVTDLALPRLNGWEAIRRIKATLGTKHVPVLALSAHAFPGDAERARAVGCDGFLTKPCLPEDLARAIRSLIKSGTAVPAGVARSARRRSPSARRDRSRPVRGERTGNAEKPLANGQIRVRPPDLDGPRR